MITRPVEIDDVTGTFFEHRLRPAERIFPDRRELHMTVSGQVQRSLHHGAIRTRGRDTQEQRLPISPKFLSAKEFLAAMYRGISIP